MFYRIVTEAWREYSDGPWSYCGSPLRHHRCQGEKRLKQRGMKIIRLLEKDTVWKVEVGIRITQMRVLVAKHWTEHWDPNGGVRARTEGGAEGVCNPIGRTTVSTNQSSQGLNHQPKSILGGTHGSSSLCSRGWPCRASLREKARGPRKD